MVGQAPEEGSHRGLVRLVVAGLIWPLTYVVFQILSDVLPPQHGYLAGFVFYWALLAALNVVFLGRAGLAVVTERPPLRSPVDRVLAGSCLAMALPPFFLVFLSAAPELTSLGWLLLIAAACCNGTMEELFWRGVFVHRYSDDVWRAYILPTLFFTLWHLTLVAVPDIHYDGGKAALVGGAAAFGIVWGYVAFRQRSVVFTTLGHVAVNFFAFSGLIQQNWPG